MILRIGMLVSISILFHITAMAQMEPGYFGDPVNHKVILGGSFGELRGGHFHTGLDIKPSGNAGADPIIAAADGYISRVNIGCSGYGNALYIDHPNGYTTVYAHLSKYADKVAKLARKEQYSKQSFEINLALQSGQYPVTKGDTIGWMGNTGRSYGAHLHFEIHRTATENPINPILFGIGPEDHVAPTIQGLKVYHFDQDSRSVKEEILPLAKKLGNQYTTESKILSSTGRIGFGVEMYDQMDGASNKNGVYRSKLYWDGKPIYGFSLDSLSFADRPYYNCHIDYAERQQSKRFFTHCFIYPVNPIFIYDQHAFPQAYIPLSQGEDHHARLEFSDIEGNMSTIDMNILYESYDTEIPPKLYNYKLLQAQENIIETTEMDIYFKAYSFTSDLLFPVDISIDTTSTDTCQQYRIGNKEDMSIHSFDVFIKNLVFEDDLKPKVGMIKCNDGKPEIYKGDWIDDRYHLELSSFGDYQIGVDTIAPTISTIRFQENASELNSFVFKVEDNYHESGSDTRLRYEGRLDGEWTLLIYDLKSNTLTYPLDDVLVKGNHELTIAVWDAFENKAIVSKSFIR